MNNFTASIASFARDEEGAQVVEYALIIALVSIVLATALGTAFGGGNMFTGFVTRVQGLLAGPAAPLPGN